MGNDEAERVKRDGDRRVGQRGFGERKLTLKTTEGSLLVNTEDQEVTDQPPSRTPYSLCPPYQGKNLGPSPHLPPLP